MVSLIYTFIFD